MLNNKVNQVSFGSTYRIPLTQHGVKKGKKMSIRSFAHQFQNKLTPACDTGFVRVSIRHRLDEKFEKGLKMLHIGTYQKFDRHNIPTSKIDAFIKEALNKKNFIQFKK